MGGSVAEMIPRSDFLGRTERSWSLRREPRRGRHARKESGMTERRSEEREKIMRNEDEDRRREEKTRRAEQLRDAWRRNHPSEPPEGSEKGRPKKEFLA
jgi:hypothetical protein